MYKYIYTLFLIFNLSLFAQNEVCFEIEANPNLGQPGFSYFTKYVNVLDCFEIFAESSISDAKVLHAAAIAAELLDNDEDGVVDDEFLRVALESNNALIPIFSSEWSQAANNFMNNYDGDGVSAVLFNNEIDPNNPGHWGDDASVEEIIHTINHVGHVSIYPTTFELSPNSSIMSNAMDIARGGQFLNVPNNYPEEAWYHYDDWTCDYECMAIEYLYWCIVSNMGILADTQTCNGIANEWEPCTPELFESMDLIMYDVVTNPQYKLPQLAPDGNYCPMDNVGDINEDGIVNILDIILTVNMILGYSEANNQADLNGDNFIDVLDIILLVNFILDINENQLPDECYLIPETGPCMAAIPIYYYDSETENCDVFIWGGCGGVVPFETMSDCVNVCE